MTRTRNTLTAVEVQNAAPGKLSDGGGLLLDRRRIVLDAWARHVTGLGAQVVRIGRGVYPVTGKA